MQKHTKFHKALQEMLKSRFGNISLETGIYGTDLVKLAGGATSGGVRGGSLGLKSC